MTLPMVTCPLCCRPGFSSSESLSTALVDVTTRILSCPICNHEVTGLDKFTIHLFTHTLNSCGNHKTKQIGDCETSGSFREKQYNRSVETDQLLNKCYTNDKTGGRNEEEIRSTVKASGWRTNNVPMKYTTSIPNEKAPVIYFRSDNGQMFTLTQENIGSNLKNVTINTQNYITSTNITTSTVQTNLINNLQKRKYCQVLDQDCSLLQNSLDSKFKSDNPPNERDTVDSWIPALKASLETDKTETIAKNEKEFESCKDLLTKGDFTTNVDDLSDTESIDINIDNRNNQQKNEVKSSEATSCEQCSYVFPNKIILAMHNQLIHKKTGSDVENKRKLLVCNLCPRTFSLRSSLMIHRKVAHAGGFGNNDQSVPSQEQNQNISCPVCGKNFSKDSHLSQHMKVHDEKQWQCSICGKGFTTKYFLKKHRRLHTGEMPYKCKTCSKSFTFQQTYRKHLLYHNNDKPYCCAQCGRLFKELSTLHNHERIHSGEKPFTCETCGKSFRQRVSYLVHRRIHTGAMPYKCTACDKCFRYKISQRTHKCTAQPPGIVVRTQGYLMHKLQAAMNKLTESDEVKYSEDGGEDKSGMESKATVNDINKSDNYNNLVGTSAINDGVQQLDIASRDVSILESSKIANSSEVKVNKPQLYLLVKGSNGETYYQPLILSQNFEENYGLKNGENSKSEQFLEKNQTLGKNEIPECSNSLKNNQCGKSVTEVSVNSSLSVSTKHLSTNINTYKESSAVQPGNIDNSHTRNIFKLDSTLENNKSDVNDVSCGNFLVPELFDNLIYVGTADNQKVISQDKLKDASNEKHANVMDSNADTVIESSDLFSLMLSPSLSSPSDRFGRLSLSPNSTINNSIPSESYGSPTLVNNSLNDSPEVGHDTFFENITDDTLKELLFGGVN